MRLILIASLIIMTIGQYSLAQTAEFTRETYIRGKDTLLYRMLLPENFDPGKTYPVLFFLHGSGERGNNNEAQLMHGSKLFLSPSVRKDFPAIVIFPQCPADDFWANIRSEVPGERFAFQKGGKPNPAMKAFLGLVSEIRALPYTDNDRVYVGGLSMGGMGTLEALRRKPKVFAAGFVICGGDTPENAPRYKKVPLWFFHGAKDNVVPMAKAEAVAERLKELGSTVKFTVYPEDGHNSWDSTFKEPGLLPWLFSQRR